MKELIAKFGCFLMACILFILPACVEEEEFIGNSRSTSVKVIGRIKELNNIEVASRVGTKSPEETKITSMCLFIFDNAGQCVNVQFLEGNNPTFIVDREILAGLTQNALDASKMYIIANVGVSEIKAWGFDWDTENAATKKPSAALSLTAFLQKTCAVNSIQLPESGFPMKGSLEVDLRTTSTLDDVLEIALDNLYAKIVFKIHVNTNQSLGGTLASFNLLSWEVHNLPKGVRLQKQDITPNVTETPFAYETPNSAIISRQGTGVAQGNADLNFSFYMPEHMVKTDGSEWLNSIPDDIKDKIKAEEVQRYKPKFVPDGGKPTFVRLNGNVTDHQGHITDLSYDVYLGSNNSDNFQIERNCQYNNNITITGITNHNHKDDGLGDGVVSVDHRVNINSQGYTYAIEQEASLDAHWNVIPMDLYVEDGQTVTVSLDGAACKWIRMEKIFKTTMEAAEYEAYTGVRDYFTTNLVTETLAGYTSFTCSNRDRIYFYIDENISLSSRQATISLVYSGDANQNKNLTFKQSGLKKVIVYNRDSNGSLTTEKETIYIEDKEEYLYHYDPLNKYDASQVYEGLPWGGTSKVGNEDTDNITYYNGRTLTEGILDENGAGLGYNPTRKIKEMPVTAAEYCNNKGKRNPTDNKTYTSVSEDNGVWFLPAIREMEAIMRTWYSTYEDFQENFYWSSAPAKTKGGFLNLQTVEDSSNARATRVKVTFNSGDPVYNYYESGSTNSDDNYNSSVNYDYFVPNGTYSDYNETNGGYKSSKFRGGRAPRGNKYRVRAAYVPPIGYTVTESGLVKQ